MEDQRSRVRSNVQVAGQREYQMWECMVTDACYMCTMFPAKAANIVHIIHQEASEGQWASNQMSLPLPTATAAPPT